MTSNQSPWSLVIECCLRSLIYGVGDGVGLVVVFGNGRIN
jgi:hypothetical protein